MAKKNRRQSTLERLGAAFKQARLEAGLTQSDVHAETGIAIAFISKFENGKCNISIAKLEQLGAAVGLELAAEWRTPKSASTR